MSNVKILVIEDDNDIREAIVDTLEFGGYETAEAANGLVGVAQAKKVNPDLIICDVMMPELDGYGVLLALSEHTLLATTPFIFLTAKATQDDLRMGMNLGADDYIVKPFKAEQLLKAVETRLERHKALSAVMSDKIGMVQRYINLHLPHELRTPLTGVRGYVSILQSDWGNLSGKQIETMLSAIDRSAERLHFLIENYMAYTQLQMLLLNEELLDQLKQYSLMRNPEQFVHIAAEQAAHGAGRLADLSSQTEGVPVIIYQDHLKKVVVELVKNGCSFSEKGTDVQVTAAREGDEYVLRVKNVGRGMTAEQIAGIGPNIQFERHIYEQQGVGLGLVIVRDIIALYDGRFEIESVPDEYLTATVRLPIAS